MAPADTRRSGHVGTRDDRTRCGDMMLWVSDAPREYRKVDEYLQEASLRGCCRQIPFIPDWLEVGTTRVFLAHRGGEKSPSRGVIFGYYVADRLEVIAADDFLGELSSDPDVGDRLPQDLRPYVDAVNKWKKSGCSKAEIKRRLERKLRRQHLPRLVRKPHPRARKTDDDVGKLVKKILQRVVKEAAKRNSKHQDHRAVGGSETLTEAHRSCSLRKGPGAIYVIDALCAAVHDRHGQLLARRQWSIAEIQQKQNELWDAWLKEKPSREQTSEDLLNCYYGPFRSAVDEYRDRWQPKYAMDKRLEGKASRCGELVVFDQPYPILEKSPRAAFRSMWHIDGDILIEQIAGRRDRAELVPKIHSCGAEHDGEGSGPASRAKTATRLAEELHLSKACADRFLDEICRAREEVPQLEGISLHGFGTIGLQGKKSRKSVKFELPGDRP